MSTSIKDVHSWLAGELAHAGPRRKAELMKLVEHVNRAGQHPSSATFPVGSFQRQIAQLHERKIIKEAVGRGFQPHEDDLKELGLHIAGQSLGLCL